MGNILSFKSRYEAETIDEIRDKLSEFGICYVPNVLTDEERLEMISGTWDFFDALYQSGIQSDQLLLFAGISRASARRFVTASRKAN